MALKIGSFAGTGNPYQNKHDQEEKDDGVSPFAWPSQELLREE